MTRAPFAHSGRYRCAPGCPACFYERFARQPLYSLHAERYRLMRAHGRGVAGIAWPHSNYRRALDRAIADKRRAL